MSHSSIFRTFLLPLLITLGMAESAMTQKQVQPQKVGFVNIQRIFEESQIAKASAKLLQKEFSSQEKELIALSNNLKVAVSIFERDAVTLTESQFNQRQREIERLDRNFQDKRDTFQENLNNRKAEELLKLQEAANTAIRTVAEGGNYAYILTEAAYIASDLDITDAILKALNQFPASRVAPSE